MNEKKMDAILQRIVDRYMEQNAAELVKAYEDVALHGVAFWRGDKRVDPRDVLHLGEHTENS